MARDALPIRDGIQSPASQRGSCFQSTGWSAAKADTNSIENLSSENVYIQSGDIVKGGQQDRVALRQGSHLVLLRGTCRWSKRGVEPETQFSASILMAPNNVKMAARDPKNQAEVWNQLANSQQGLATATAAYVDSLSKIVDDKNDVVGYAYAINGKVNSAEVYASNDLFRRMWPKLLKSSAAEALTEKEKTSAARPDIAAVEQSLSDAEHGRESSKEVKKRVSVTKKESDSMILFETRVKHVGDGWLHRSYVAK